MKLEQLGNCVNTLSGFAFKSELFNGEGIGLPLIRVRDVNSGFSGMYYSGNYSNEYVINNGDILIGMDGEFNVIVWKNGTALLNQRVCKLVVDEKKLNKQYLLQYLPKALKNIHGKTTFTTVKHLSSKSIEDIQIPLPENLDDQISIATVLTRAEKLIAKRKESIKELEELLKSTFLEIFGDPVRNEKGWEIVSVDNVVTSINSGTSYGGDEKKSLDNDELGVLKISAVTQGIFNPCEYKAVKRYLIKKDIISVKKGMFLFSRANTKELVAACCIVKQDYPELFLPDKLWVLSINDKVINPIYLNYLFKNENYSRIIREKATGGHDSMLNISIQKFRNLTIPKPPLELQNQMATIVEKVEALKAKYLQSLTELENLFGSLSQRAFKGELDLSKVPMGKEEQVTELPEEIIGTSSTADEISESKILSETELVKIIRSLEGESFNFLTIMTLLEKVPFGEIPRYEELKKQIYKMLEGTNPLLSQTFDKIKKEIVLRVNI